MPLRVVMADDNLLVREGLRQVLAETPELELVALCEDRRSLTEAVDRLLPDVVVTDIRMPPFHAREGIEVALQLHATHPQIGVVVLSQYTDALLALELFQSGSGGRGYLLKERLGDRAELVAAIQAVAAGRSVIDPKIVDELIAARARSSSSLLGELTAREREVLGHVAAGESNGAIASMLFLTKRAVEKHINAIFMKLNLQDTGDTSRRVVATLMFLGDH